MSERSFLGQTGQTGLPGVDIPLADPASPLDEMQFLVLRQAVIRRRPIRRAARVARWSAWTILVIGLAGWPVLLLAPSLSSLVVVCGICAIGVMEYIGAGKLQRGQRDAPAFLARNQLIFVILIAAYCVYQMITFSSDEMQAAAGLSGKDSELMGLGGSDLKRMFDVMMPVAVYGFYSLVMLVSAVCQGGLALYYITRRKHIEVFERDAPPWVKRILAEVES
jgi:hypothetical protein